MSEKRVYACDGGCGQTVATLSPTASVMVAGWMILYGAPGGVYHLCSATCLLRVAQVLHDRSSITRVTIKENQ